MSAIDANEVKIILRQIADIKEGNFKRAAESRETMENPFLGAVIKELSNINEVIIQNESQRKKAEEENKVYKAYSEVRLHDASEMLMEIASLNFDKRARVTQKLDAYDGLSQGLNMLSEELKSSTVSRNYLDDIFQSMTEILIVVDAMGFIQSGNEAAKQVLGEFEEGGSKKCLADFIYNQQHQDYKNFTPQGLRSIIKHHNTLQIEISLLTTDARELPVEVVLSPMRRSNGLVLLARDITERKLAELRQQKLLSNLEKSNRELKQFAYITSHDLKAPLRAISMLAQRIYEENIEVVSDESAKNLELLIDRVKRMYSFLEGVLVYSKIGQSEEDPEEVELNQLVRQIVDAVAVPQAIEVKMDKTLPPIRAVKTHMIQLFQNLLSNAVKYMDKSKGLINVGCEDKGGQWEFYVKDNGRGIESAHFERIFVIFQTLTARDDMESTGMGLTIVKKIVQQYGGDIWVESVPGKGSRFYFTLNK